MSGPATTRNSRATTVMRIALTEAACKVRTGGPQDDAEDMEIAAWTGVLPLSRQRAAPLPDAGCTVAEPAYVKAWRG